MTLVEGIKNRGRPFVIPESSRDELPGLCKTMGYKVGVEIGVYKGAYTEKFLQAGLQMYAIDPWCAYKGAGRTQQRQERQDFLFGHTHRALDKYPSCTIIRETSCDALKHFKDNSIDFVYIDGDHSWMHVATDVYNWANKVKPGGLVCGHDYHCTPPVTRPNLVCHVQYVIDAYTKTFDKDFYIFGIQEKRRGKDDKYFSWMFFK